jgi:pentatricopeptide repeat protein
LGTPSQLPIGTRTTPGNASTDNQAAAALLQQLSDPKTEATFNFFNKDEKGVKKLETKDAFADAFSGRGEIRDEFKTNFSKGMRDLLADVEKDGTLSSVGISDPDAMAKEIEAELGSVDDPEAFGEKLNAYINHLEEQLVAQGEVLDHYENMDPEAMEEDAEFVPKARKPQAIPQIPAEVWTINQRKRVSKLNSVLERVFREMRRREETTAKTVLSVWKAYNLARQTLAKSWSHIPNDVWDLLWKIFSIEGDANTNRFSYLSLLARDMSEAKVALNSEQQLITIEALFVEGFEAKAIDNWKRCMTSMGDSGSSTFKDYWELGTRMFCQSGDLAQAERAVNKLLDQQADPHILMPFIRACASQTSEQAQEKAWESYRRLRELLGADMGLEEYDEVIAFFLTTNQTERALFAFVDMMTSGTVDLYARGGLPSQIGNKFFFGKWLKRLIGAEDLDGAFAVFEFMRSKGIEAAPVQINGLIGAWHRAGGADDLQKADDLAWDMIRARIDFVQTRQRFAALKAPFQMVDTRAKREIKAAMPKATLETFSLLAENYRLRGQNELMNQLWDAFREAEISPDAFMMNQLIETYSQFGNIQEARALYGSLVHERGVRPDSHTYMALWKMLGANRLSAVAETNMPAELAGTRETFAEMVRHAEHIRGEALDGQLARKVLHTFRRLKDHPGLVVALRALKVVFNYTPPEVLALEMAVGSTNLAWNTASARQKLRITKRRVDAFVEQRQRGVGQPGVTLDDMTHQQRGDVMLEYLEHLFTPQSAEAGRNIAQAAEEMGVYDVLFDTTGVLRPL